MATRRHRAQHTLDFGIDDSIDGTGLGGETVRDARKLPPSDELKLIEQLDTALLEKFRDRVAVQKSLSRQLVSFQANKGKPAYRWYKYKEAFSAPLIDFLLERYDVSSGKILDPFAGAGTALFVTSGLGIEAHGIELLPIGQEVIRIRLLVGQDFAADHFARLKGWIHRKPWKDSPRSVPLPALRITEGAYPPATVRGIQEYLGAMQLEEATLQGVLRFALLCVLESMSYTRKDGQYLRWDYRSGRKQGAKRFDKGVIWGFDEAISSKLAEIVNDLSCGDVPLAMFPRTSRAGTVKLFNGSCLDILPRLSDATYDAVITSPPYCNRYDYTRTYALELALLGISEHGLAELRQEMISCTVENKAKGWVNAQPHWKSAIDAVSRQELIQTIFDYLDRCKSRGMLNNNGIPRMVRGYFHEMACVISECQRVMKPGAVLIMVNDNVRYAGASISVDLILSEIGERLGFRVEGILVLPNGKGNSSQQMGSHGRDVLRKCVYVWRK